LATLKVPSFDAAALLDTHRKNAAALTSANQVAFDGLKTLAQRQRDLIKETVDDCGRATSDVLAAPSFEEKATRQADATHHLYVSTVARCRELAEIVITANVAALDIVNARIAEACDELRALFVAPAAPAEATAAIVADPVIVLEVEASPVDVDAVAPVEPEPTVTAAPEPAPPPKRPSARSPRRPTPRR
jgi:phasin family protein